VHIDEFDNVTFGGNADNWIRLIESDGSQNGTIFVDNSKGSTVQYVEIPDHNQRMFRLSNADNMLISHIKGYTASSCFDQCDGIFAGDGSSNVIMEFIDWVDNNEAGQHTDGIQYDHSTDGTVRWSYFKQNNSKRNDSQGVFFQYTYGTQNYIYGNVIVYRKGEPVKFEELEESSSHVHVYNNTIVKTEDSSKHIQLSGADTEFKNNVVYNIGTNYMLRFYTTLNDKSQCAYNAYHSPNHSDILYHGGGKTLSEWKSLGGGMGSIDTSDLSLDSSYRPNSSSDPTVGSGDNTLNIDFNYNGISIKTAINDFTGTINLVNRDITGNSSWDIGAYEFTDSDYSDLSPPSNLRIVN
jgi:hypothetical protein